MDEYKPPMCDLEENDSEPELSQPEFPPGMAPKMLKMVKVLNDLESKIEPLISKPHHEILNKLSPLERAKVGLMEVYTINSLYWVLMRTSGEDVDSTLRDDYKVEMGRLKETQSRLTEVEARSQRQGLDVVAASRFIHHGLGISRRQRDDDEDMEQNTSFTPRDQRRGHKRTSFDRESRYQEEEIVVEQDYTNNSRYQEEENVVGQDYQDAEIEKSVPSKGKKKRKMKEECIMDDENEDSIGFVNTDNQVGNPVASSKMQKKKKKKKKVKQGVNVSSSDISTFLDTARGRIDYEIEDDSDAGKKGRNWYEQGWT